MNGPAGAPVCRFTVTGTTCGTDENGKHTGKGTSHPVRCSGALYQRGTTRLGSSLGVIFPALVEKKKEGSSPTRFQTHLEKLARAPGVKK